MNANVHKFKNKAQNQNLTTAAEDTEKIIDALKAVGFLLHFRNNPGRGD